MIRSRPDTDQDVPPPEYETLTETTQEGEPIAVQGKTYFFVAAAKRETEVYKLT